MTEAIFLCPVCGAQVPAFNADEIPTPPAPEVAQTEEQHIAWAAEAKLKALVEANEAVLLQHVQINHSIAQVLEVLGTARNALMDVREMAERAQSAETLVYASDLIEAAQRGLGGK